MNDELAKRLSAACEVALAAGRETLKYFRQAGLQVDLKSDATPVTIADRQAEQLIRSAIETGFSGDGFLGEESGEKKGTSGWRWIVDPIDGTKSFIHGVPLYAVLIGIEHAGQSRIGVIHLPALEETVYAAKGQRAWCIRGDHAPQPARVSNVKKLSDGLFCTSSVKGFRDRGAWPALERLTESAKISRTWGDAFGYALVATGRAEVMIDPAMNLWDAAAVLPIIEEAGGKFTDWKGSPTIAGGEGIASNGLVHDEVLQFVSGSQ
jgi:histidinol-phosphatase